MAKASQRRVFLQNCQAKGTGKITAYQFMKSLGKPFI